MSTRTTSTQVTFQRPFIMSGFSDVQAAGTYTVDTEEEQMDVSFPAWKRTATVIQIARAGAIEHVPVDAAELHEALMRDGAQEHPAHPSSPAAAKKRRDTARTRLVTRKNLKMTGRNPAMEHRSAFDMSRIQAEGWNAARKYLMSGDPGDVKAIAALNPYRDPLERARWYTGFNNAVETM